jgi:hypothetical protein
MPDIVPPYFINLFVVLSGGGDVRHLPLPYFMKFHEIWGGPLFIKFICGVMGEGERGDVEHRLLSRSHEFSLNFYF